MPRPQFTLRALLVAVLVVAAFFGGMVVQRGIDHRPAKNGLRDIPLDVEALRRLPASQAPRWLCDAFTEIPSNASQVNRIRHNSTGGYQPPFFRCRRSCRSIPIRQPYAFVPPLRRGLMASMSRFEMGRVSEAFLW
jgi:hypothetical protein